MGAAPAETRFWAKTLRSEDGCITWTSVVSGRGYGRFVADGKRHSAHRWIYELTVVSCMSEGGER